MTGCERVLALLSDGKPHTHHEIYALHVVGHSRIADLRKRGHVIHAWRDGALHLYQLASPETVAAGTGPLAAASAPVSAAAPCSSVESVAGITPGTDGGPSPVVSATDSTFEQLSLVAA